MATSPPPIIDESYEAVFSTTHNAQVLLQVSRATASLNVMALSNVDPEAMEQWRGHYIYSVDYNKRDILFHGFVKWDGCAHLNFGSDNPSDPTADPGYLHLHFDYSDSGHHAIGWALGAIWEKWALTFRSTSSSACPLAATPPPPPHPQHAAPP